MKEQIIDLLHFRHACKEFDPSKKIGAEEFETILQAGRLSPSSFGVEPWKFLVIQNPELREKIRVNTWGAQKQLPTCSHYVIILARKSYFMRFDSWYVENYMRTVQKSPEDVLSNRLRIYKNFQESDFDLANNDRALFDWASKQTYIALANMMTIAAMQGIDSCPVEGFNMPNMEIVLKNDLGVDTEKYGISVMAAFGYRINPVRPKTRLVSLKQFNGLINSNMFRSQINPMPPFFDRYINMVDPDIKLIDGLQKSLQSFVEYDFSLLGRLGEKVYELGKWTVKDILLHVIDNERIQAYRAMRFARNDMTPLPGYDEQVLAAHGNANKRLIQDLKSEFVSVRLSTITLFKSMDEESLMRVGTAYQVNISPLALGFVLIGHQTHHFKVIEEKYLPLLTS